MRIALQAVDDSCADHIAKLLREAGHSVHSLGSVTALKKAIQRDTFDLLICERPSTNADLCTLVATGEYELGPPLILLTASTLASDIAALLHAGADDVLIRPFGDAMLTARVEAVLRRAYGRQASRTVEVFGDYRFNKELRSITCRGFALPATAKEFKLALVLFQNLGRSLSRDYLMDTVWCEETGRSRTLDSHISTIRGRLGILPENGLYLGSVYGFGYVLRMTRA